MRLEDLRINIKYSIKNGNDVPGSKDPNLAIMVYENAMIVWNTIDNIVVTVIKHGEKWFEDLL